ncbi:hypothetical protein ACFL0V_03205 [Nanoarchaeota archaeon]
MLEYIPAKHRARFQKYGPIKDILAEPNNKRNRKKLSEEIENFKDDLVADRVPARVIKFFKWAPLRNLRLTGTGRQPNWGRSYPPSTRADAKLEFKEETLKVMRKWKKKHPFRPKVYSQDAVSKKLEKFKWLSDQLADVYGIKKPDVIAGNITKKSWSSTGISSGLSFYDRATNKIKINGKFSVVTFLHEFGHARGFDEVDTVTWSVNLYTKIFPVLAAQLSSSGHAVRRRSGNQ